MLRGYETLGVTLAAARLTGVSLSIAYGGAAQDRALYVNFAPGMSIDSTYFLANYTSDPLTPYFMIHFRLNTIAGPQVLGEASEIFHRLKDFHGKIGLGIIQIEYEFRMLPENAS